MRGRSLRNPSAAAAVMVPLTSQAQSRAPVRERLAFPLVSAAPAAAAVMANRLLPFKPATSQLWGLAQTVLSRRVSAVAAAMVVSTYPQGFPVQALVQALFRSGSADPAAAAAMGAR